MFILIQNWVHAGAGTSSTANRLFGGPRAKFISRKLVAGWKPGWLDGSGLVPWACKKIGNFLGGAKKDQETPSAHFSTAL